MYDVIDSTCALPTNATIYGHVKIDLNLGVESLDLFLNVIPEIYIPVMNQTFCEDCIPEE